MTTVADILAALERIAPLAKAGGWDPVGLQLGDPMATVRKVAVCHEVTAPVAAAAAAAGADMLVSYHPLLFRPTTSLVAGSSAAGRAFGLVSSGIALAVVHTAYDVAPGGVADALAAALGLEQVTGFGPNWAADTVKVATFVAEEYADGVAAAMADAGGGVIGLYTGCSFRTSGVGSFFAGAGTAPATGAGGRFNAEPEVRVEMVAPAARCDAVVAALVAAHPYEEPAYDVYDLRANAGFIGRLGALPQPLPLGSFAEEVQRVVGAKPRVAGSRDASVARVAVVPGSGASFIGAARRADVLVTGDVGHHDARRALEAGMSIIDPGHAPTERPGVRRLYAAVANLVDDAIDLTDVDANPWEG